MRARLLFMAELSQKRNGHVRSYENNSGQSFLNRTEFFQCNASFEMQVPTKKTLNFRKFDDYIGACQVRLITTQQKNLRTDAKFSLPCSAATAHLYNGTR